MVKPSKKTKKAQKMRPKPRIVRAIRNGFDAQAAAYARLLLDPCHAPLTRPVGTPTGGILFRAQSIILLGSTTVNNSAAFHWVPSAMNASNTELLLSAGLNGATNTSFAPSALAPAKTFVANSASDARCVAACVRIMYDGAESGRAGRVAYGNTVGGSLTVSTANTYDSLMAQLETMERTPQTTAEIRWKPTDFDTTFVDPGNAIPVQDRDRRGAITIVAVGHPIGNPLTLELTAVYEYLPAAGQGIVMSTNSGSTSDWTPSKVVNRLSSVMENPWVQKAATTFLSNLGTMGTTTRRGGRRGMPLHIDF